MGKRSNFKRKKRDFYSTPIEAVEPLIKHLSQDFTFAEPCAGNGALCRHLEYYGGNCLWASDIEPQHEGIIKKDFTEVQNIKSEYVITNPPWDRNILHPLIDFFRVKKPTWLLFDADWMHTKQAIPFMVSCKKIISIGRVKWFGNTTGKDNCVWGLFDNDLFAETVFVGRS